MRPLYPGRLGYLCELLPDGAGMTNFLLVIRRYGNRSTRGDKEVEAGGRFLLSRSIIAGNREGVLFL